MVDKDTEMDESIEKLKEVLMRYVKPSEDSKRLMKKIKENNGYIECRIVYDKEDNEYHLIFDY